MLRWPVSSAPFGDGGRGFIRRSLASVACLAVVAMSDAVAQNRELNFKSDRNDPQRKALDARRARGLEAERDVIFARCKTLGFMTSLGKVPELLNLGPVEIARIQAAAERTIRPVDAQRGCQVIYEIPDPARPDRIMRVELFPRSRVVIVDTGQGTGNIRTEGDYCRLVLRTDIDGEFVRGLPSGTNPATAIEPANRSRISSCRLNIPYDLRADCNDLADTRCQSEPLMRSLQRAIEVVFVP